MMKLSIGARALSHRTRSCGSEVSAWCVFAPDLPTPHARSDKALNETRSDWNRPNNGGIDPLDVTYVTFTGNAPRASGQDIYNHDKHTALGETAAKAFVGP
jgi:hypothetical protein